MSQCHADQYVHSGRERERERERERSIYIFNLTHAMHAHKAN